MRRPAFALAAIAAALPLSSCTHFAVDDCTEPGGRVLGEDVPRIRSSHLRMKLADSALAAARFLPYAAMSALAYAEDGDCGHPAKIEAPAREQLLALLQKPAPGWSGWSRVPAAEKVGPCEDASGLFYNVWKRESADAVEVVLAFRGTWGWRDWLYGNLHWLTRFFIDDQYPRARAAAGEAIRYFSDGAGRPRDGRPVRILATGHSLGGGLAQTAFYAYPRQVAQVFAFDPSPVTDYREQDVRTQQQACACDLVAPPEARIYRFYESYEILTHVRFVHKLFFAPNRHIHEVRFGFPASANPIGRHSMVQLAMAMGAESAKPFKGDKWYAGVGAECTARFEKEQARSCAVEPGTSPWSRCPQ